MWMFSSTSDHTLSDPLRPALVVGASGPWIISLTDFDPFGNRMPFTGIKFILEPGGTPFVPRDKGGFAHAVVPVPDGTNTIMTDFWHLTTGTYQSDSGPAAVEWQAPIPPNLTTPAEVVGYMLATVPEPSTTAMLLIAAAIGLVRYRRHLRKRRVALVAPE
jgi:hypothetical protein